MKCLQHNQTGHRQSAHMVAGDANCETRVSFGDGAREEGVGVVQRRGLGDPYSLVDMVVVESERRRDGEVA